MTRTTGLDLSLYAILDPEHTPPPDLPELCTALIAGGATLIQLRDKHGSARRQVEIARALIRASKDHAPVLINDRIDVAIAATAHGVHLGQDDIDVADARRMLGEAAIIGLTIKTRAQAEHAPLDLLDYVCIGGVFATRSKDNPDPPVGLAGLREMVAIMRARAPALPIGAIAGINLENVGDVIKAGADGVALISALCTPPDPARAASDFRAKIDAALLTRRSGA